MTCRGAEPGRWKFDVGVSPGDSVPETTWTEDVAPGVVGVVGFELLLQAAAQTTPTHVKPTA
jgi:hypothetical protein